MLKIGILVGSTRPGRKAADVAAWVHKNLRDRTDASFEIVDIANYNLPLLDEPVPPSLHQYTHPHTNTWSQTIAAFDGFVFVTPEYNHATSGALKNAIDFLFLEWNDKAAGFVGYGSVGGARAIENLRLVMGEIKVADVRTQVGFSLFHDFENYSRLKPTEEHRKALHRMADELVAWAGALKPLRAEKQPR